MIKMANSHQLAELLQINVIDFEWGGQLGVARYPHHRNNEVGYPSLYIRNTVFVFGLMNECEH